MTAPWILPADITAKGARDWKKRNALVETALRLYLAATPVGRVLSTVELSQAIATPETARDVGLILTKLAPWMGKLATHDGEAFIAYGRANKRWRWHGQLERADPIS